MRSLRGLLFICSFFHSNGCPVLVFNKQIGGGCYHVSTEAETAAAAQESCKAISGKLFEGDTGNSEHIQLLLDSYGSFGCKDAQESVCGFWIGLEMKTAHSESWSDLTWASSGKSVPNVFSGWFKSHRPSTLKGNGIFVKKSLSGEVYLHQEDFSNGRKRFICEQVESTMTTKGEQLTKTCHQWQRIGTNSMFVDDAPQLPVASKSQCLQLARKTEATFAQTDGIFCQMFNSPTSLTVFAKGVDLYTKLD